MTSHPHRRRQFLGGALSGLGLMGFARADAAPRDGPAGPGRFDVRDFGATGDGVTGDTAGIQAAVDAASASGGGIVFFPTGRFLSGTVVVRSRVTLHLSPGAVLLGSTDVADYPAQDFPARDLDVGGYRVWALLYAQDAEQIAIEGDGVIDGSGESFPRSEVRNPDVSTRPRPRMIFFRNCRAVSVRDVTLRESGLWTVHLALCDSVRLTGLRITSTFHLNQDGIVLDSCRDATVSDCDVRTVDDALVLKSSFPSPCRDVTITNCVLQSSCAGLKLGTQSLGGFRNIAISNCVLHDCRLGGLKFQTVDGGDLEDVTVHNVVMHGVAAPLSLRRGARGFDFGFRDVARPRPVGRLRNVLISQVRATLSVDAAREGHTMSIAGLPGHPVENVTLENVEVTAPGGGTPDEARRADVPERETAYPEHTMFGTLPASGLWVRHAARVTVRHVHVDLAAPDARPALFCEDVDDLEVTGLRAPVAGAEPLVRLRQVRGALLQGCRPIGDVDTFVRAEGGADVALLGNDLRRTRQASTTTEGFVGAVAEEGNLGGTPGGNEGRR